jgi:pilus assembly protein CpaB
MDVKKIMLLVGALVVALVSAFFVRQLVTDSSAPAAQARIAKEEKKGPKVLVATKPLPIGTILTGEEFKYQPWPKDMVQNAYFLEGSSTPEKLNGKVVRFTVPAGQPLTKGNVVGPGERGFLAAALTPGMRAVTVSISDTSGVAGFIFPGDRVDMLLTQGVDFNGDTVEGLPADSLKVTETILRNVRILAVDQRTNDGADKPNIARTVTFEVPPKFVEKIVVAQSLGKISLSLRPLAESRAELEHAIAAGEIEVGDNQDAATDRLMELAAQTRPTDSSVTFTTGGEVSRFASTDDPRPKKSKRASGPAGPTVRVFRGGKGRSVGTSPDMFPGSFAAALGPVLNAAQDKDDDDSSEQEDAEETAEGAE